MEKKNLVLDLDETLVHSFCDTEEERKSNIDSEHTAKVGKHIRYYEFHDTNGRVWGMKRPYVTEFLKFCNDYFDNIGIWSAGTQNYVESIVKALGGDGSIFTPAFILSRKQCDVHKGDKKKPLWLIYQNYPEFSSSNTLFIDDNYNYAEENLLNWIQIPLYDPVGDEIFSESDTSLKTVEKWLKTIDTREDTFDSVAKPWTNFKIHEEGNSARRIRFQESSCATK